MVGRVVAVGLVLVVASVGSAQDAGQRAEQAAGRAEAAAERSEAAAKRTEAAIERLEKLLEAMADEQEKAGTRPAQR
jgi:hypothetical protein